ncbi:MAG: sodium:proton antiporter [Denitromonas halophila]|uniref:Sodium:proton antiporter n=3 Tax=Denitromonas TaxID=139331 RepID=A0A557RWE1_9RHOO|nr:sodium:proton antiporter [Denitromonas ohlonensis]TVO77585.1 sodium:proton antiporter [Denitromonas ohlonensis]TVT49230.1 MAG: sodium:proton antiporter [Denitromonas halophila]TVT73474.1 MAG: sodium:proton antiporter [Denitromonas halophila]TVT78289.1 MAG: sodium:proton antiporter [Denitromonas halophila]
MRLPAILFLLIAGIVAGPIGGWLDPDALLGDLLFPFVSLAVSVILFEGSLTLKFSEIRGIEKVVRRFVTTGALVTWVIVTLATQWITGISWGLATLFGAVMVVTGPTVIVPMLRTVRPTMHIANVLRWEGIVIDPIGALLAVLVYEFLISSGTAGGAVGATLIVFLKLISVGSLTGIGVGYLVGEALRRDWLPHYMFNVATLAAVMGAFALSNALSHESGLLAVTVMGIYLANRKGVPVEEILSFKESLSLLLITALFILLAARLDLSLLLGLGWGAVQIFLVVQFVARPVNVLVSTRGSSLSWRERGLLAWIAPRGIVAAAVIALFSLQLEQKGYAEAVLLVPLTFVIIIGTVVLQSLTAGPLARLLNVAEPGSGGFLIVGANPLARAIAKALTQNDVSVRLTDMLWDNVSRARMAGLQTYYGNPLSEHAEVYLNTAGLGRVLAMTADEHLNELACTRFKGDFGPKRVFALRVGAREKGRKAVSLAGLEAFGEGNNFVELSRRLARGAEIRQTNISEAFSFEQFSNNYGERAVPLFAIDPKGRVEVFATEAEVQPKPGWMVLALVDADPDEYKRPAKAEKSDSKAEKTEAKTQ